MMIRFGAAAAAALVLSNDTTTVSTDSLKWGIQLLSSRWMNEWREGEKEKEEQSIVQKKDCGVAVTVVRETCTHLLASSLLHCQDKHLP